MMTGMLAMNLEVKTVPCQEILVRNIKYQIRRIYRMYAGGGKLERFHYLFSAKLAEFLRIRKNAQVFSIPLTHGLVPRARD